MAWIESHTNIIRHRKVCELARELRLRRSHVIGHLHALWHAALEQQDDGDLTAWSDEFIAEMSDFPGDAPQYVRLLQKAGFLDGRLIHDWIDYAGRFLRARYSSSNPDRLVEIWAKHGRIYGGEDRSGKRATPKRQVNTTHQPNPTNPTNQPNKPDTPHPPKGGGRKKRTPSPAFNADQLASAERIYAHYPRKIAHKAAIKAICVALADVGARGEPDPENYLLVRTRRYADQRKAQHAKDPDSMRFTPHPASWFNAGRYDDEPESSLGLDQWIEENGFVARNPTDEDIRRAMGGDE